MPSSRKIINLTKKFLEGVEFGYIEKFNPSASSLPFGGPADGPPVRQHIPLEMLTHDGMWIFMPRVTDGASIHGLIYQTNQRYKDAGRQYHFQARLAGLVWRDRAWRKPADGDRDIVQGYVIYRMPGGRAARQRRMRRRADRRENQATAPAAKA